MSERDKDKDTVVKRCDRLLRHSVNSLRSELEYRWARWMGQWDWVLRRKYNRWARWGVAKQWEDQHRGIIEKMLAKMDLSAGQQILDLGCGEGMASRLLAERAGSGSAILGVDIADEMIRNAEARSSGFANVSFQRGAAEQLPCLDNSFDQVLSVEAFYYFKNQQKVLQELLRVLKPGGGLFMVVCLHQDNPEAFPEVDEVKMPVHIRSADEYQAMLWGEGWVEVEAEILRPLPKPGVKPNMHERSLAIVARKPIQRTASGHRDRVSSSPAFTAYSQSHVREDQA